MAVGDTLPHCTGTGTSADPYKYSTAEGFNEAIAVEDAYVEAATENLIFDVNDGVIPNTLVITCYNLNGKGTTIRNLYLTSSGNIISFANGNKNYVVSNMNFYNMLAVFTASNTQIRFIAWNNDDYQTRNLYNCNFTGVVRGSTINYRDGIIFNLGNSYTRTYQEIKNCTFNFNIQGTSTGINSGCALFYVNSSYLHFINCTFAISGTFNYDLPIIDTADVDNCTFTNKSTNPIVMTGGNRVIGIYMRNANYNYVKFYVTCSNTVSMNFATNGKGAKTLVNRSRIDNMAVASGSTCISMQETDSTQSDYIYDATNLANAGFLVGTVVE